jgi:hypothetical protein
MNEDLLDYSDYATPLQSSSDTFASLLLPWLLIIGALFGLAVAIYLIRRHLARQQFLHHEVFQIRLPRDLEAASKTTSHNQYLRESISKMEAVISYIGGLKAQRGLSAWLHGRSDIFSLEIVAHNSLIDFFLVSPRGWGLYLEKQVHALYPDAEILRVKDYNIFGRTNYIAAGYLVTRQSFFLPIKTYVKQDSDPMNSILNVLTKLAPGESVAIQFLVRSAHKSWHKRLAKVVKLIYKKQSLEAGLKSSTVLSVLNTATSFSHKQPTPDYNKPAKRLSAMEEEVVKGMEEKNSKAGLDINIRIVASSANRSSAEHHLGEVVSSFSQYNFYSYGNSFADSPLRHKESNIISDFIYRRFSEHYARLFNTEELASLYHFPLATAEMPNLNWLESKLGAAPVDLPSTGCLLGYNNYRGVEREIRIKDEDRLRHLYMIGKSGVGKSFLLANMAIQDIYAGHGVCVLDPHGDLIDDILLRIPPERAADVILFSPADTARPMSLNLLEFDPHYPEQKSFVINEMIGIFDKLYDLRATGGPIFEQYMRNAMLLIMAHPESGATLMEIPKVLADPEFRKLKLKHCTDPTVVDFWVKEAEKAGGDAALANVVPYITSKLTAFISNDMMRPIIGQQQSSFNLREVMDSNKILLVSLPKGLVGEANSYLLGMILVGKILMAALSRADLAREQRKNFYLYIDEFQNFTTASITQVLSEARKYGLGLTLAHQYIGQLSKGADDSIKNAVFGNVGTTISFKVGPDDAEFLAKLYEPDFSPTDLVNLDKYTTLTRLLVDNLNLHPFTMKTAAPLFGIEHPGQVTKLKEYSRLHYGRDRQAVEAEIWNRMPKLKKYE